MSLGRWPKSGSHCSPLVLPPTPHGLRHVIGARDAGVSLPCIGLEAKLATTLLTFGATTYTMASSTLSTSGLSSMLAYEATGGKAATAAACAGDGAAGVALAAAAGESTFRRTFKWKVPICIGAVSGQIHCGRALTGQGFTSNVIMLF